MFSPARTPIWEQDMRQDLDWDPTDSCLDLPADYCEGMPGPVWQEMTNDTAAWTGTDRLSSVPPQVWESFSSFECRARH